MNPLQIHELLAQSMPEQHSARFMTIEGLTIDDMLTGRRKTHLIQRLREIVGRQLRQWRGQQRSNQKQTAAEPQLT